LWGNLRTLFEHNEHERVNEKVGGFSVDVKLERKGKDVLIESDNKCTCDINDDYIC